MDKECFFQNTISDTFVIEGIGIHSGSLSRVKFHPAEENTGIVFLKNGYKVKAHVENVVDTSNSTSIGNGIVYFRTIEHIMAALYLANIDNVVIEFLDSEESPIMDGSACEFFKLLEKNRASQSAPKLFGYLSNIVRVSNENRYIMAKPNKELSITYEGFFGNFLKHQIYTYKSPIENLIKDKNLISARTFCHIEDIAKLKKMGLGKGGSLENNVVLTDSGILNKGGLRHSHEPVSHKVLDLIGDLYLAGIRFSANIYSYMGGHKLNVEFVKEAIKHIKTIEYTSEPAKIAS